MFDVYLEHEDSRCGFELIFKRLKIELIDNHKFAKPKEREIVFFTYIYNLPNMFLFNPKSIDYEKCILRIVCF